MRISRRSAFANLVLGGGLAALSRDAFADTVTYTYDALGRVVGAAYADGSTISYIYDAAGNRTQVLQSLGPFVATLQITGSGPANLRSIADAAGYNAAQDATITFEVGNGVTITGAGGAPGGYGIDTGTWPSVTLALTLLIKTGGTVRGGGGRGGIGGGPPTAGQPGSAGGDAIYLRVNMTGGITVQSGATVQAGGGGGGGGAGFLNGPTHKVGGGGGGGGRPNGPGGPIASGMHFPAQAGTAGTPTANGVGGAGGDDGSDQGAPGANGGSFATVGGNGGTGGGAGGAAGYAIRKNGFTATVTNNGTITGTVG